MALFNVPQRAGRDSDMLIAKRTNSAVQRKTSTTVKGGGGLMNKIALIKSMVEQHLGHFADETLVIQDEKVLHDYITKCIENGVISIDTETTGFDPLINHLVGPGIYTPGEKTTYIPFAHISYITHEKVANQLSKEVLHDEFQRIVDSGIDVIMFNATFDIRFMRSGVDVDLTCTWDCSLASRLLNENEPHKNLKQLHQKYCLNGEEDAFRFDDLFKDITFDLIPISVGALYAAHDPKITYELYDFQRPYLTDTDVCKDAGLEDVAWVFHNIEMPLVRVIADMEDIGVDFDFAYNELLQEKYHNILAEKKEAVYKEISMYESEISAYRLKHSIDCKLDEPINIGSPAQLGILLYDIIGYELFHDKKSKKDTKSTSEEALQKINTGLTKSILEYRSFSVLVSTFIDKLPECVNPKDGRIHCKFNQYGADTGRMSSSNPNLQNIPSHNKDIRKMFKASNGYVLLSSDYSQQEPKALAALCKADGDSQMYDTFMQGKDLYSEIASKAFNVPYEDCKEFRLDGTTNKEGKERRTQAKSILLGVLYGRGEASIAEQLGTTTKKAQAIKESVFKGFPAIKQFEERSIQMSKDFGYVTTVCGRKRRLPSMMLPDYDVVWKDGAPPDDDLLSFDDVEVSTEVPDDLWYKWVNKVKSVPFRDKHKVFKAANEEGLWIIDHTKDKDVTKVVNARIQGSAADLTKLAMIRLANNNELKSLGFRMLIPVHDEIIAECPEENAKECSELLAKTMSEAAEQILKMPIKCDVEITKCWYGESVKI